MSREKIETAAIIRELLGAGCPPRLISDWPTSDADLGDDLARWWTAERTHLLAGPAGSGKSRLAVAMLARWFREVKRPEATKMMGRTFGPVIFTTPKRFLGTVQAGYAKHATESAFDAAARFTEAEILVFDDFGKEHLSDDARGWIEHLVDERWGSMAPTIITTNLGHREIRAIYGDRVASRLADVIVRRMEGRDHRMPNRGTE